MTMIAITKRTPTIQPVKIGIILPALFTALCTAKDSEMYKNKKRTVRTDLSKINTEVKDLKFEWPRFWLTRKTVKQ